MAAEEKDAGDIAIRGIMTLIPVTYRCWGCGESKEVKEPAPESPPVPALEKWNLCPDCVNKEANSGQDIPRDN